MASWSRTLPVTNGARLARHSAAVLPLVAVKALPNPVATGCQLAAGLVGLAVGGGAGAGVVGVDLARGQLARTAFGGRVARLSGGAVALGVGVRRSRAERWSVAGGAGAGSCGRWSSTTARTTARATATAPRTQVVGLGGHGVTPFLARTGIGLTGLPSMRIS